MKALIMLLLILLFITNIFSMESEKIDHKYYLTPWQICNFAESSEEIVCYNIPKSINSNLEGMSIIPEEDMDFQSIILSFERTRLGESFMKLIFNKTAKTGDLIEILVRSLKFDKDANGYYVRKAISENTDFRGTNHSGQETIKRKLRSIYNRQPISKIKTIFIQSCLWPIEKGSLGVTIDRSKHLEYSQSEDMQEFLIKFCMPINEADRLLLANEILSTPWHAVPHRSIDWVDKTSHKINIEAIYEHIKKLNYIALLENYKYTQKLSPNFKNTILGLLLR